MGEGLGTMQVVEPGLKMCGADRDDRLYHDQHQASNTCNAVQETGRLWLV